MKENKDVEITKVKNDKFKTKPNKNIFFSNLFLKNKELKQKEKQIKFLCRKTFYFIF